MSKHTLGAAAVAATCLMASNTLAVADYIVSADALSGTDQWQQTTCMVAISANEVGGNFVASVLEWRRSGRGGPVNMRLRVSPGQVDWTTGIEELGYAEEAWIEVAGGSTRSLQEVTDGDKPYFMATISDPETALAWHEQVMTAPVTIAFTDGSGETEERVSVGRALELDSVSRSRDCMAALAEAVE